MFVIVYLLKIIVFCLFFLASNIVFAGNLTDPPKYLTRNYKLNKNFLKDLNASGSNIVNRISWQRNINPLQKQETIYLYIRQMQTDPKFVNPEYIQPDYQIENKQFSKTRIIKMLIQE